MIPLSPATRIFLASGATDLRNYSERLIIPSSGGKDLKSKAFPAVWALATRNNQRP
jgi:hypothetical protein